MAADQQQPADRRADRDAEVGGDANRRVRRLVALGRDEVGDHRLVGGAAERAEHRQQREQDEPGRHVCPTAIRNNGTIAWKPQPTRISGRRPIRSDQCPPR